MIVDLNWFVQLWNQRINDDFFYVFERFNLIRLWIEFDCKNLNFNEIILFDKFVATRNKIMKHFKCIVYQNDFNIFFFKNFWYRRDIIEIDIENNVRHCNFNWNEKLKKYATKMTKMMNKKMNELWYEMKNNAIKINIKIQKVKNW